MNWSDPNDLKSASALIQWVVIGLATLAVCLQTAKHYVDLRERAITARTNSDKDDKQQERERQLRNDLKMSERRIRSFALEVTFDAFAKWKGGKPPDPGEFISIGSPVWTVQVIFLLQNGDTVEVPFRNEEALVYRPLADGVTNVSYWVTAAPGCKIFSMLPEEIASIRELVFTCPGFNKDALEEQAITIGELKLSFAANGHVVFRANHTSQQRVTISDRVEGDFRVKLVRALDLSPP